MKAPPLLPIEVLRRVLRLAQFDGTGVLAVAGVFALISAAAHDTTGAAIGLIVALAGAIELHGAALLRHGAERGVNWLITSQFYLMGAVLAYVAWRLTHIDIGIMKPLVTDDLREKIAQIGMNETEFLRLFFVLTYGIFGVLTVLYQGGMAIYYTRRRTRVIAALHEIHGRP